MISGGVVSRRLDKKLGCFCFGGLDLLEPQFDRENRMGALRPNVGETDRGERKRDNNKTQSAPLAQRVQEIDKELQEYQQKQEPQNR